MSSTRLKGSFKDDNIPLLLISMFGEDEGNRDKSVSPQSSNTSSKSSPPPSSPQEIQEEDEKTSLNSRCHLPSHILLNRRNVSQKRSQMSVSSQVQDIIKKEVAKQ